MEDGLVIRQYVPAQRRVHPDHLVLQDTVTVECHRRARDDRIEGRIEEEREAAGQQGDGMKQHQCRGARDSRHQQRCQQQVLEAAKLLFPVEAGPVHLTGSRSRSSVVPSGQSHPQKKRPISAVARKSGTAHRT